MSTVASLQSELKNLSVQSRRRNSELSSSIEKSLVVLDAVTQSFISDREVVSALRKYPDFVTPFILACSEASAKSCASALQCIQNLAMYRGISPSRLSELLDALMEATQLGLGIQLKILQVLPLLLHEFAADLSGELIVELLQVCAQLLSNNKVAMVHNAAYATLQQLVTGVFDRTEAENSGSPTQVVTIDASEAVTFEVTPHLHDAIMILLDLCDIAERQPPRFIKIRELPLTFTLELLELTLSNQAGLIHKHSELGAVLRLRITPLLLRLFSEASEFATVLRVTRIFYLLLRQHIDIVTTEAEVILSAVTQGTSNGLLWKRSLCLEILQGIFLEGNLVLELYSTYDGREGRTDVIKTIITEFANLLSSKGGLLLASEMTPEDFDRIAGSDASGPVSDVASVSSSATASSVAVTSSKRGLVLSRSSNMKQPVIDMLDRVEPPRISNEYAYLLILKSLNSLADDIHKLAPSQGLVQGLCRKLATPLLKCFSVALGAAMDLELYRAVVRSVQRLAHSAGILVLKEPRDDFMKLLNQYSYLPDDPEVRQRLLGRITLCIRALFNLGYALGNQLGPSWSLVADAITQVYLQVGGYAPSEQNLLGTTDPDYRIISGALRKLVDGSTNLSNEAVIHFMSALGKGNEAVHLALLEEIVYANLPRFADPESLCWSTLASILLRSLLRDGQKAAGSILNRSALRVMAESTADIVSQTEFEISPPDKEREEVKQVHGLIMHALCDQMKSTHSDVRVHTIENINGLLDKFGGKLLSGWEELFSIISPVPSTGDIDLMRSAFRTLELICSDFLENLPYSCVFSLTLCLDEFSRQTTDLNTSFTSTSLFWGVCDHLMSGNNLGEDLDGSAAITEKELVVLARDESCPSKRFALWLLAVLKLAEIARTVPQHQVRTGAIQIFLRLFNTHGHKLPPGVWSLSHKLTFPALLDSAKSQSTTETSADRQETLCLIIEGVSKIFVTFLDVFVVLENFKTFVKGWVDFLNDCIPESPRVALASYESLLSLLSAPSAKQLPKDYMWQFWVSQNRNPSNGQQYPKDTADALMALVSLYSQLKSSGPISDALELISDCVLFPYYRAGGARSTLMSPLQETCTKMLDQFVFEDDTKVRAQFMSLLGRMALSPYEEPTAGNSNFIGLSAWAQHRLGDVVRSVKAVDDDMAQVVPGLLKAINKVLRMGGTEPKPTMVLLLLLEIAPGKNAYDERELVEGGQLILSGGGRTGEDEEDQTIDFIERFVKIAKEKETTLDAWKEIIGAILSHSVIYERSGLTLNYYLNQDFDVKMGLEFGTVETPTPLHRQKVAYHCLELMRRLATTNNAYAAAARELYAFRIRAVLLQYIGDCRILGAEPVRKIVRDELHFILQQLKETFPKELELDGISELIIKMIPRADRDVLPMLQQIIKNQYM